MAKSRGVKPCFESHDSYTRFALSTRRRRRYVLEPEAQRFLEGLLASSEHRVETIPADKVLWRAQLGFALRYEKEIDEELEDCYPLTRMVPLADRAREGRANPKGIPSLYLATKRDTAIAEVRPWMGSYVSVSQFGTNRELRLVNCTVDKVQSRPLFGKPKPEFVDPIVWTDIDRAFSRPVTDTDDVAEYVPTQIVAELLRSKGYDGIAYRSGLGEGHNIALFDLGAARALNGQLFRVSKMQIAASEAGSIWFARKPAPKSTERTKRAARGR